MSGEIQAAEEKNKSKLWEDIDAGAVAKAFSDMRDDLDTLRKEMLKLEQDKTNYDKTKAALTTVRDGDFSQSGWISSFIAENTTAFPGLNGDGSKKASRPDWYHALLPDKRKKYDEILDFMDDAVKLSAFFKPFAEILTKLPLDNTFRVFAIIKNMATRGWSTEEYQKINKDIETTCTLLNYSWADLDGKAPEAERYYQQNISRMDSPKAKEGYFKLRQDAYAKVVDGLYIGKSMNYRGNGRFGVLADRIGSMRVMDAYMGKLVMHKDLGGRLAPLVSAADELKNSMMGKVKVCTGPGRSLYQGMLDLIVAVWFFMNRALEEFNKFKEGSSEAPYCYMKCPEEASKAKGWFGFEPAWGDSWSKGTGYYEIYRKALYAITAQCHDFAYVHGRVH
ncbi:MAG: hypothetical protein J5586_05880 [Clostridia bacterium]|nr:hypothetical protein [Clostridia bacterium]